jgi:hypothetical protein
MILAACAAAPVVANIIAVAILASTASVYPAIARAGSAVTCASYAIV